jgi:hypothetical protein
MLMSCGSCLIRAITSYHNQFEFLSNAGSQTSMKRAPSARSQSLLDKLGTRQILKTVFAVIKFRTKVIPPVRFGRALIFFVG